MKTGTVGTTNTVHYLKDGPVKNGKQMFVPACNPRSRFFAFPLDAETAAKHPVNCKRCG